MYINNDLTNLIFTTVNEFYAIEKNFYAKPFINFNKVNWNKFKHNEIQLKDLKSERVQCILDDLFTSYEQYLIAIAQQNIYFSKFEHFTDFYTKIKLNELKNWFETQSSKLILKSKKLYDIRGNLTKTYFILQVDGTHKTIQLIPQNTQNMPLDDNARLKWIENNLQYMK